MTEQEFRAAVLEVFPRHIGIRVWMTRGGTGLDTRIGEIGESFFISWHGNARRSVKWRVHAGGIVGKGASLQDAVKATVDALLVAVNALDNQRSAMISAQQS